MASNDLNTINVNAAFACAHAGFLRTGEFTQKTGSDPIKLQRRDVTFDDEDRYVCIRLRQSKTDKKHEGVTITIAAGGETCPVRLLRRLFKKHPAPKTAPLFAFTTTEGSSQGRFHRIAFLKELANRLSRQGMEPSLYKGHSFRRGAQQDAIDNGLSEEDSMVLGRWTSNAVKLYYSHNTKRIWGLSFQQQTGRLPPLTLQ